MNTNPGFGARGRKQSAHLQTDLGVAAMAMWWTAQSPTSKKICVIHHKFGMDR